MDSTATTPKQSFGSRALNGIERAGNLLPHPVWLFALLAVGLSVLSALLSASGVQALKPDGEEVPIRNLLSTDGIRFVFSSTVENFMLFPPFGTALVALIGLAIADRVGLITAFIRQCLARVSPRFVTPALAFTGSFAHVAGDAGYILLIPLAGVIFRSLGRNPIIGSVVAFVALSGGSAASPILIPNDAVFAGITTAAAQTVDPRFVMTPVGNIYFTVASSIVITLVITLVTEVFLAHRIDRRLPVDVDMDQDDMGTLSPTERRGLRNAGLALLIYVVLVVAALIPPESPLRGESGGIIDSVVISSVVVFLSIAFALVGTIYGLSTGSIRQNSDIPRFIAEGLREMTPIIVLFFAISQFLAYFSWTNIGVWIATSGAEFLTRIDAPHLTIFLGIVLIVSAINFVITSGSAQWSLVGPVFVPMLMLLDIPPETTTALYRIADSCTNVLTPMSPYFALTLTMIQRHRKDAGIGSLFTMTLPLAAAIFVAWTALFAVWYLFGLPLGPGASIR